MDTIDSSYEQSDLSNLQSVQAYISAPVTAVFLGGILWKGATGKAAFITLITGGILGLVRFILDIISKSTDVGVFQFLVDIPFLNFCVYVFIFCIFIIYVVSKKTRNPEDKLDSIQLITFGKSSLLIQDDSKRWNIINLVFSGFVALSVILLWAYFS